MTARLTTRSAPSTATSWWRGCIGRCARAERGICAGAPGQHDPAGRIPAGNHGPTGPTGPVGSLRRGQPPGEAHSGLGRLSVARLGPRRRGALGWSRFLRDDGRDRNRGGSAVVPCNHGEQCERSGCGQCGLGRWNERFRLRFGERQRHLHSQSHRHLQCAYLLWCERRRRGCWTLRSMTSTSMPDLAIDPPISPTWSFHGRPIQ